jgi:CO dehydrogenase/acetyl-CoA synthase beta subunit
LADARALTEYINITKTTEENRTYVASTVVDPETNCGFFEVVDFYG